GRSTYNTGLHVKSCGVALGNWEYVGGM
ncbi:hypothetical protein A2U01_0117152, partial [Trifolium medium]|nr:hypothetical protein [Trifolium medium]